jgi:NAD(P)-dependent dehydrogenase (short-subunit alcohol dehydrogenase family)
VDEVDPESVDWIGAISLRAPRYLAQQAAWLMGGQGSGSIINVGSLTNAIGLDKSPCTAPSRLPSPR